MAHSDEFLANLPFPLNHLYDSAALLADNLLTMQERLQELSNDHLSNDQLSNDHPSNDHRSYDHPSYDHTATSADDELQDVKDFHGTVHSTLSDILSGNTLPPGVPNTASLHTGPTSFVESVQAFVAAVDWKGDGHWLFPAIAAQLLVFLICVRTRRQTNLQIALFLTIAVIVRCTEYLNAYLATTHASFATQNYFDPSGFFAATFFAGPLLLSAMAVVCNLVLEAGDLLVKVKRKEFAQVARKSKGGKAGNKSKRD